MTVAYTVALCTHNHADRLRRTLTDLAGLNSPNKPWEFLIVDNGCSDETPQLLSQYQWPAGWLVRVVREDKLGLSNARNRAIAEAAGDYVIFMDDDETADPDWLCAYERLIEQHKPDSFGGRIRVLFEDARPAWLLDDLLGFLGELNRFDQIAQLTSPSTSFYGGNFGLRKAAFDRVGGFDDMLGRKGDDNTGGEEVDFYRRLLAARLLVWWTPEAVIYHRIQASKLSRRYFLDLHFRQGKAEGKRARGKKARIPPLYLYPQLLRALSKALSTRFAKGRNHSLRKEMNVAYFLGYLAGWGLAPAPLEKGA
ncbi:MAG: glycosyltransferase family 2 protein [Thiobacillaceae bacterium]